MKTVDDGEVGEILMHFVGGSKLNNGEVMESGNHSELMRKDGWYARMVEQQRQAEQWVV